MEAIHTLCWSTNKQHKTEVANTITSNYGLPFNANDVVKAINHLQPSVMYYEQVTTLMHLSLTTNLRMFIALIYALLDNRMLITSYSHLITPDDDYDSYVLGCCSDYDIYVMRALQTWSALYDYYEFDTSELAFSNAMREGLQKHINSKAIYTKPAIKAVSRFV